MATCTRGRYEILLATVTASDACEPVMKVSAFKKAVDDLFDVWTPEAELFRKAIVINPHEFLKVVFDATIPT